MYNILLPKLTGSIGTAGLCLVNNGGLKSLDVHH